MPKPNRRAFVQHMTTTAAGVALASPAVTALAKHHAKPRFTIGLSHYSLRALIGPKKLSPLTFPQFTVDNFGIHAIDLWEGGFPKDKLNDPKYLTSVRKAAETAKSDLFLLMTGALDANPRNREKSLKQILPSLDRAELLGTPLVRVFLRAPGKDEKTGVKASVEALKPLADAAAEKKLTIAIEPGASHLSAKGAFLAKVATELNHPACKLMPDFGKLKNNVYDGTEAMLPHTTTISCKMHSFDENGKQPDFDYDRLMKMIVASKYRGILAIEWEGRKLKPIEGVKASQKLIADALKQANA